MIGVRGRLGPLGMIGKVVYMYIVMMSYLLRHDRTVRPYLLSSEE